MNRLLYSLMGGVLAVSASTAAEAAFSAYIDSPRAFVTGGVFASISDDRSDERIDLGEVVSEAIDPNGDTDPFNDPFAQVEDRANVLGAFDRGSDEFLVNVTAPVLRFDLKRVLFDGTGQMRILIESNDGELFNKVYDATNGDLTDVALGAYSGVTSINIGPAEGASDAIAYEFEVVATPLPGALVLFGTGLAGIAGYRRWVKPAA